VKTKEATEKWQSERDPMKKTYNAAKTKPGKGTSWDGRQEGPWQKQHLPFLLRGMGKPHLQTRPSVKTESGYCVIVTEERQENPITEKREKTSCECV
jgi:hypothetical protein